MPSVSPSPGNGTLQNIPSAFDPDVERASGDSDSSRQTEYEGENTTVTTIPPAVYTHENASAESASIVSSQDAAVPGKEGSLSRTSEMHDRVRARAKEYLNRRWLSGYKKVFAVVFTANMAIMVAFFLAKLGKSNRIPYRAAATPCSANLLASVLIRNEHVVNVLFWLTVNVPDSWPYWTRRASGMIYTYGGIHSGCAVASVAWYMLFAGLATYEFAAGLMTNTAIVLISWIILTIFTAIIVFAHPRVRVVAHNAFENVHRYGGWAVTALFWVQTGLLLKDSSVMNHRPLGRVFLESAAFWCLLITTLLIIYPWARLRLRTVEAEPLSDHAIRLHFNYRAHPTVGAAVRLADNPLKEGHAFATIPNPKDKNSFSVVVSNAGDWTKKTIDNPPKRIWIRGSPVRGVLRVATLFTPVIVVATGSGIAPCLSLFIGKPKHPCYIIWSTQNPMETYGPEIVNTVLTTDPGAVIIDTKKNGRPDLVKETYTRFKEVGAEGVIVISNAKVTGIVAEGLRRLGVPTRAPIFDS